MPKVQTKAMIGCGFPLFATAICVMCFLSIVSNFRKNEERAAKTKFSCNRWSSKGRL